MTILNSVLKKKYGQKLYDAIDNEKGQQVMQQINEIHSHLESIKTYEDACKVTGDKSIEDDDLPLDVKAYIKLRTIAKALRNGWKPNWADISSSKYFPRFEIKWKKFNKKIITYGNCLQSIDIEMPCLKNYYKEEEKAKEVWKAAFGGDFKDMFEDDKIKNSDDPSGETSRMHRGILYCGSALVMPTAESAVYFGMQFNDLWKDFLVG